MLRTGWHTSYFQPLLGSSTVIRVARIGDQSFRAAPPPLWASDHFGMTARIVIDGPD
jgi:hypothetical protein